MDLVLKNLLQCLQLPKTTGTIIIMANATVLGISGIATVTVDPTAQTVVEVIEFQNADLAHGNIAISSDDTANPNTITINLSEETSSDEQTSLEVQNITVFNYSFDGSLSLADGTISLDWKSYP